MFAEVSHLSHVVSTDRGKLLGAVGSNAAADGRMRESFYDCSMKNETPILPEDLKQFACELDQARRASIAGHGADKCGTAQAYRNFEDAVRKAPEYEEATRQFYAMLILGSLDCNGTDAFNRPVSYPRQSRERHHSMAEVPEGLSLDEYRMRQAYYARAASRLPIGSDEKRSALEQVRLTQRMIDRLRRQGKAKPEAS